MKESRTPPTTPDNARQLPPEYLAQLDSLSKLEQSMAAKRLGIREHKGECKADLKRNKGHEPR